jgi:hypothetical protein
MVTAHLGDAAKLSGRVYSKSFAVKELSCTEAFDMQYTRLHQLRP